MTLVQNEMSEDTIAPTDGTPGHLEYATPLMRHSGWWGQSNASRIEVWERTARFEVHRADYTRDGGREWKEWRRTRELFTLNGISNEPLAYQSKQDAVVYAKEYYRGWQECVAEDLSDQWDRHLADLAYERQQPSQEQLDRIHAAEEREGIDGLRRGLLRHGEPDGQSLPEIEQELYR
jgi:hypothetical protein